MTTVNLSRGHLQRGALTANDPTFAVSHSPRRSTPLTRRGVGASIFVLWAVVKDRGPRGQARAEALDRLAEAINRHDHLHRRAQLQHADRARPSPMSPAATSCCRPSSRAGLHRSLDSPELVGVNPEFAHETMSGLSFHHGVARHCGRASSSTSTSTPANWPIRPRLPLRQRRGQGGLLPRPSLRDVGLFGMRHFDAHPYRTEVRKAYGLRARLYPHVPHLEREGGAIRGRSEIKAALRWRAFPTSPRRPSRRRIGRGVARYVKTLDESA